MELYKSSCPDSYVKVTLYSALSDIMLVLGLPSQDGKQFITVSPTPTLPPFHGSVTRT